MEDSGGRHEVAGVCGGGALAGVPAGVRRRQQCRAEEEDRPEGLGMGFDAISMLARFVTGQCSNIFQILAPRKLAVA